MGYLLVVLDGSVETLPVELRKIGCLDTKAVAEESFEFGNLWGPEPPS